MAEQQLYKQSMPMSSYEPGQSADQYARANPGMSYESFAPGESTPGQGGYLPMGGGGGTSQAGNISGGEGGGYGGGDPFDYTGGTLLTPWTKPFNYTGPGPSGGGFSMDPFKYGDIGYNFSAPGAFQGKMAFGPYSDPTAYKPDQVSGPSAFSGQPLTNPGSFGYTQGVPGPYSGNTQVGGPQGPGQFNYTPMGEIDRFAGPGQFQAPTLDETNDPGYKFRREQGLDAIQNRMAAQGVRGGDVARAMSEYSQNYASSEYDKVYGRAFGAFNQDYANRLSAYQTDTGTQMAANQQRYGQASNQFGMNTQAQQAYDQMRMQNEQQNVGNSLASYNANLAQQQQGYGQAANTFDMNTKNKMATEQFNAQQSYNAWLAQNQMGQQAQQSNQAANLQAANMNEQNRLNAYNANYNTQAGIFDRDLAGYQATSGNQLASGKLGWDIASGTWDRNYQKDLNAWQQQYQMGAANAAAGASAGNQEYNRALQQYQMEYDIFNNNQSNQFNRLYTMANMGQQSANSMGQFGGQYAANMGNLYAQGANAYGAGQMGQANAWGGGMMDTANTFGAMAMYGQQPRQPVSRMGGGGGGPQWSGDAVYANPGWSNG